MIDYLEHMLALAFRKELQGIHFWASVYVLVVLIGTLWHALRVRGWPCVKGQLQNIGIRPLGVPDAGTTNQDYVPSALYQYQVNGKTYTGRDISIWKMSASGLLKDAARLLPRQVQSDDTGKVLIYYHPQNPSKSLLMRPGWTTIGVLLMLIFCTIGFYWWRW